MPIYEYECENCGFGLELSQSYHDKPKTYCKKCHKYKLLRTISMPHVSVLKGDGEIKLSHMGHRNNERYGLDQKESLERKHLTEKQLKHKRSVEKLDKNPHETKTDDEVRKMTGTQKDRYIIDG